MSRTIALSVVALTILLANTTQAAGPAELKLFMRAKLDHSKNLLEAITTENFDAIAKESQKLMVLTLAEQWQVLQTPEYEQQSRDFRRTADAIRHAAEKKNIDGAALGYLELTMKCVNCHKYIKKERMAATSFKAVEQYVVRP
ncbi:MAG TPA: hypothetical protein VL096_02405 [Pirellulaceae bacterium]|nr:hypothetical protein [Pirellulaceae bacterium]